MHPGVLPFLRIAGRLEERRPVMLVLILVFGFFLVFVVFLWRLYCGLRRRMTRLPATYRVHVSSIPLRRKGPSPRLSTLLDRLSNTYRRNEMNITLETDLSRAERENHGPLIAQATARAAELQRENELIAAQIERIQATTEMHRREIDELVSTAPRTLDEELQRQDAATTLVLSELDAQATVNDATICQEKARVEQLRSGFVALVVEAEPVCKEVANETALLEVSRQTLADMNPGQRKEDVLKLERQIQFIQFEIMLLNGNMTREGMRNAQLVQVRDALKVELEQLQRETAIKVSALDEEYAVTAESNKAKLAVTRAETAACITRLEETRARTTAARKARAADLKQREEELARLELKVKTERANILATRANRKLVEEEIAMRHQNIRKFETIIPALQRKIQLHEAHLVMPTSEILNVERKRYYSASPRTPELSYSRSPSASPEPAPSTPVEPSWL
ncbi:hypothetical protein K474DRAFT_1708419 [Panus rudis PR-1116 ss-1]|nr:hypothetical protein K474DRAFT_1708419 [Panus rudis PR-1116 ss-1]